MGTEDMEELSPTLVKKAEWSSRDGCAGLI
jgi:hypothetical protein